MLRQSVRGEHGAFVATLLTACLALGYDGIFHCILSQKGKGDIEQVQDELAKTNRSFIPGKLTIVDTTDL